MCSCPYSSSEDHCGVDLSDHRCPLFFQEMGLKVGQEASFAVQLNGARGLIDAKIHTPSGATEECYITELDSGKTQHSTTIS